MKRLRNNRLCQRDRGLRTPIIARARARELINFFPLIKKKRPVTPSHGCFSFLDQRQVVCRAPVTTPVTHVTHKIVRRWQNFTGHRAVHAETGLQFPLPPEPEE